MYHISEEIRSQNSARRICKAVMDCAKRKPLAEITVSELYRDYLISRTTFYRLFDNVVDVLEYQCELTAREIFMNLRGESPQEILLEAIRAVMGKKELIEILARNGRIYMVKQMQEKYLSQSALGRGLDLGGGCEYFQSILAQIIPAVMEAWIWSGQKETPEEIYARIRESLNMLNVLFN